MKNNKNKTVINYYSAKNCTVTKNMCPSCGHPLFKHTKTGDVVCLWLKCKIDLVEE